MAEKIQQLILFLESVLLEQEKKHHRGRPSPYSQASMTIFFVVMMLKKKHTFSQMAWFAQHHFRWFGWSKPPCRQTLTRRFKASSHCSQSLLPWVVEYIQKQVEQSCCPSREAAKSLRDRFCYGLAYIDKTVFRAKGGLWHKKQMLLNVVPHPSIDCDASWAKSDYHGWRFGYGLHLITNGYRFPISCSITTGSAKDHTQVCLLLSRLKHKVWILVGDAGYFVLQVIEQVHKQYDTFLQTAKLFVENEGFKGIYNGLAGSAVARAHYQSRKPSIEPCFALLKSLFDLEHERPLPYKGFIWVEPYLSITVLTLQLMMYDNWECQRNFGDTQYWNAIFK